MIWAAHCHIPIDDLYELRRRNVSATKSSLIHGLPHHHPERSLTMDTAQHLLPSL